MTETVCRSPLVLRKFTVPVTVLLGRYLPPAVAQRVGWGNAAALFGVPMPR